MNKFTQLIISETEALIAAKGLTCPAISDNSEFFQDLPLDSLDLATLIVNLELQTGLDPFRTGFKTFHRVGELAALYQELA
jgi:acyl carrier protein